MNRELESIEEYFKCIDGKDTYQFQLQAEENSILRNKIIVCNDKNFMKKVIQIGNVAQAVIFYGGNEEDKLYWANVLHKLLKHRHFGLYDCELESIEDIVYRILQFGHNNREDNEGLTIVFKNIQSKDFLTLKKFKESSDLFQQKNIADNILIIIMLNQQDSFFEQQVMSLSDIIHTFQILKINAQIRLLDERECQCEVEHSSGDYLKNSEKSFVELKEVIHQALIPFLTHKKLNLKILIQNIEQIIIDYSLDKYLGNKSRSSAFLGINRTTLIEKIKKRDQDPTS